MINLIICIYIGCILIQLLYWCNLFNSLQPEKDIDAKPVLHTIVSCFKNEGNKLPIFLDEIQHQKTNEILLVDDFSTDESVSTIKQKDIKNVKILKASKNRPGKKNALLTGVEGATHEFIVLTDVDCCPASDMWSSYMTSKLQYADVVLGYGPMRKLSGVIALFSRYETYLTAIQYLSYAQRGSPYMGVGRNLAIKKSLATPHLRRLDNDQLASGDDDLLVQALSTTNNKITTCLDPSTFVYSNPPKDFRSFISQKSRHISTSTSYSWKHKFKLGLFAGTHILAYLLLVCTIVCCPQYFSIVFGFLILKWIIQFCVNSRLMSILDEKDLIWKTPILDIATFVYYVVLTPYLVFRNNKKWS